MRVAKLRALGRPITPRDLVNPKNKSGYDYVTTSCNAGKAGGRHILWRATQGSKGQGTYGKDWCGPGRRDPAAAAQDFCDHFNGGEVSPTHVLKTAGHEYEVDERDHDPDYEAALGVIRDRTAQRKNRPGYVYLIVEADDVPGDGAEPMAWGKIGYSTNPRKRVAELQTSNPRTLRLHAAIPGTEATERAVHRRHIGQNQLQEWFRLTDAILSEFVVVDGREAA